MAKQKSSLTFEGYLQALPAESCAALERLRKIIHSTAPGCEEVISYGLAAFRLEGRMLVGLGAMKTHCGLYLMSNQTVKKFSVQLERFETSTGTIRFRPDQPIPVTLVRQLVRTRIAENRASKPS